MFHHHFDYAMSVAEDKRALRTRDREKFWVFVGNLKPGYKPPHADTTDKILDAVDRLQQKKIVALIDKSRE